ncbi:lactate utilization protein C [Paenibacillus sp. J45TS6]|uniref:LutC/YkgG family protein n=1 Tax=Paenibacillus sp. J45TS6 TaxID=2807196 RepID=UPI001B1DE34E|nr:LUD domain-containing protein [Paenibacillus sp. J45TS6]GIP45776.1 lactate utilization protein C [Paenibacillus sp. J45TS6]
MSKYGETWLAELEQESRRKQDAFMQHIASKLQRPRITERPARPFQGSPSFWNETEWDDEKRVEQFSHHFESVGGHVALVSNEQELRAWIEEKAEELEPKRIICQDQEELRALHLEDSIPYAKITFWNTEEGIDKKVLAAEADIGIVVADGAAAYTGSVMVKSSKEKGRSVSLLPTVLFLIIPREQIRTRMGELLVELDEQGREKLPAGVHFISGPSRSSDIENDLTIGVHGPGIVYAIILG